MLEITPALLEDWKKLAEYDLSVNPQTGQDVDIQNYAKRILRLVEYINSKKENA